MNKIEIMLGVFYALMLIPFFIGIYKHYQEHKKMKVNNKEETEEETNLEARLLAIKTASALATINNGTSAKEVTQEADIIYKWIIKK